MRCSLRGAGDAAPKNSTQKEPFHSHVSPYCPVNELMSRWPPNNTVLPRAASKAIAWARRGGGPPVLRCAQLMPSHSHVSDITPNCPDRPPNKTVRPRVESYASAKSKRPGGLTGEERSCHTLPSHSQVVVRLLGLSPRTATVR